MQREDEILVRTRYGRLRTIKPGVLVWRKKQALWKEYRQKILEQIAASGKPPEEVQRWFSTPHPSLDGKPPKAFFAPGRNIRRLWPLVRNWFDTSVAVD